MSPELSSCLEAKGVQTQINQMCSPLPGTLSLEGNERHVSKNSAMSGTGLLREQGSKGECGLPQAGLSKGFTGEASLEY